MRAGCNGAFGQVRAPRNTTSLLLSIYRGMVSAQS
jgi:hypothetical protein